MQYYNSLNETVNTKWNTYCYFHQAGFCLPRSGKSRILVGLFWIVVIVMVCSYCANLIVYLSVFERKMPFSSLTEAVKDASVEYYVGESSVGRNMLQVLKISFIGSAVKSKIRIVDDNTQTCIMALHVQTNVVETYDLTHNVMRSTAQH